MIHGLEHLSYEDRLRVGAVQPGEGKALGRPYCGLPVPERAYKKAGEELFTRARSDRARGDVFKLEVSRVGLDVRKNLLTMRVVRHWNRLPRRVMDAPSLAAFKARLNGALSSVV